MSRWADHLSLLGRADGMETVTQVRWGGPQMGGGVGGLIEEGVRAYFPLYLHLAERFTSQPELGELFFVI